MFGWFKKLADRFSGAAAAAPRNKDWSKKSKEFLGLNPTCVACGGVATVVHHKLPFHLYPELEMVPSNWRPMCEGDTMNCHLHIGHSGDFSAYNINVDEDAALFRKRRKERLYGRQK